MWRDKFIFYLHNAEVPILFSLRCDYAKNAYYIQHFLCFCCCQCLSQLPWSLYTCCTVCLCFAPWFPQRFDGMLPLFLFIFTLFEHTYNNYVYYYSSSAPVGFLMALARKRASSEVPSRDSNSGLPYSKPTRYYLRATPHPILSHAAP